MFFRSYPHVLLDLLELSHQLLILALIALDKMILGLFYDENINKKNQSHRLLSSFLHTKKKYLNFSCERFVGVAGEFNN
jgi:hypothetical protein